jgi:hypothetical protein
MTIDDRLSAPFDASEVKFKPGAVSGNRALAMHYVDARVVMDRLDEVLGVAGWQDEYQFLPDGSVSCKLSCLVNEHWVTKMDVGGQSDQPDEGDRHKAAVSDALKRTAVKFGIGRYLYRFPQQWVDYDPQKKRFVRQPTLPVQAAPAKKAENGQEDTQVAAWKAWLDKMPDLQQVNKNLTDVGQVKGPAKKQVWDMVVSYAKRYGWEFDKTEKVFKEGVKS